MSGLSLGEQPRLNMASTKGRFENEVRIHSRILLHNGSYSYFLKEVAGSLRSTIYCNEHSDTYTGTLSL
jgi:hypothetical protein